MDFRFFFCAGETQEECDKCGKVYMAPESEKGRGACPECAPPSSIVAAGKTGSGGLADDATSYGGHSAVDSEECSRSSSMGSADEGGM